MAPKLGLVLFTCQGGQRPSKRYESGQGKVIKESVGKIKPHYLLYVCLIQVPHKKQSNEYGCSLHFHGKMNESCALNHTQQHH